VAEGDAGVGKTVVGRAESAVRPGEGVLGAGGAVTAKGQVEPRRGVDRFVVGLEATAHRGEGGGREHVLPAAMIPETGVGHREPQGFIAPDEQALQAVAERGAAVRAR